MAVRIRLTRVGATKRPSYRVVAIDKRRARDGRALETLGFYDPLTEPATVRIDIERIRAWIGKGAQPSDMVARLMRQAESGDQRPPASQATARPKARKAKKAVAAGSAAAPAQASASDGAAEATEGASPSEPDAAQEASATAAEPQAAEDEGAAGEAAAGPDEPTEAPAAEASDVAPEPAEQATADEAPITEDEA